MLAVLFVVAFLAFAMSTVAGGGAGLLLMPVLGAIVPAAQVPAALSIGSAASSTSRVLVFRKAIRWRTVALFVPAALPFAAVGAWLLTRIEPLYLELALGLFLAGNLAILGRKAPVPTSRRPGRLAWLVVGAAGGFLSGFTGAIGLVLNGFYLRCGLSKEEIVATRAGNEVLLHLAKLGLYAGFGLVTREALLAGALIAVAAAVAPLLARPALAGIGNLVFARINHAAMGLAGLAMLITAGTSLAAQHEITLRGKAGLMGIEAKLDWRDGGASLHWKQGHPPEFERTVDIEALPAAVRALVEQAGRGAERIICEHVLRIGASGGYEITIVRADESSLKLKV